MTPFYQPTLNYLVPASGTTRSVSLTGLFSATPANIDWNQLAVQFSNFFPQGVFVDNSQGVGTLTINFQPLNYNVVVPAGVSGAYQFPAALNETCSVTGNGQATCVFVDFPVLPNINPPAGGSNVTIAGPNPLPVSLSNIPAFNLAPVTAVACYGAITATGNTNIAAVPANANLRVIDLSLQGNAALAAAANLACTISLNGVQIFKQNIWVPNAAGTTPSLFNKRIDFNSIAPNSGAGNLTVNLSAALTSGALEVNAYFD